MKKNYLSLFFATIIFLAVSGPSLYSQNPGGGMGSNGGGGQGNGNITPEMIQKLKTMTIGHIFGKVVDAKTKRGIEFASVAIYTLRTDSLVGGQLTETNGDFSLDNLPFGGFKLKIKYIGYTDSALKVVIIPKKAEQDLGNIGISENAKMLNAVTITGEKSTIELKPDRKVFNVEKDLSARGGDAVDVMKNIPGVSTDADGNVTLRNNTPIIYVDGKPTTLTLEQIPADQIEKVEVITNPSAKYEADAAGGIINIVLKKNHQPGYNGVINASIGTNDQYNGMALFNVREKKFGFMLNYNIRSSTNNTNGYTNRTNLDSTGETSGRINQNDNVISKRLFQTARVGFDGYINNHNTLSITQNATFGKFTTADNQSYTTFDSADNQVNNGSRTSSQVVGFRNFTTDVSLVHTYTKADKQWTLDLNYNHAHGYANDLYSFETYLPNGGFIPFGLPVNPQYETENGGSHSDMLTGQWDFEDPINSSMKLEFGVRTNLQRQYSNLTVTDLDSSLSEVNSYLSNNYRIDNMINAAYITFSHAIKGFTYQVGLRFEETYYKGVLLSENDSSFAYQYPSSGGSSASRLDNALNAFFPSLMISEKFNDKHELQFNITRKTQRPNFRQISPFVFASDKFDYQIGNPALQPEFQNKAEINYDLNIPKLTWLSSIYGSYNQQDITQVSYTDPANPDIIISSYINARGEWRYGWENTFKITPVKGLDITADGNVFYTAVEANINGLVVNNAGISYVVKGIISYKFPLGIVGQVNGTYQAPRVIAQGNTLPLYFFDCSVSKDFGPATVNLSVSDVLNTKSYGTYYDTPSYIETQVRRRDPRYARLGVSFKFGKMDSSIFKKKAKKDQNQEQNGEDMGF